MIGRRMARALRRDKRGVAFIEFALVATVLFLVTFVTIEIGMVLWTQSALQGIAADAARCDAIGGSACTGSNSVESYVQTEASNWIMSAIANNTGATGLKVYTSSTDCSAMSVGTFDTVQITTSFFSNFLSFLPQSLSNYTISVCASYPTSS